ncbi:MAG: ABC transporter permease [Rhodospirillaceae bacterium]|nr:ABC transporter permease [Rhodospirillaceae bacterium]
MWRFAGIRTLHAIPVLIGVTFVVFGSLQLVPGDIANTLLSMFYTEERGEALRAQLGLDKPMLVQYAIWVWNLLHGDLGQSLMLRQPVAEVLLDKIGNSLILTGASLLIVIPVSFILGTTAARRFRTATDRSIVFFAMLLASLPVFWLGIVLLYLLGVNIKWFPMSGMYNMANPGGFPDLIHHLVLPAVTTAATSVAIVTRVTRGALIDTLGQPYILSARARGLSDFRVTYRHGVRNVMPTFANMCGLQIGYLFGGAIFTEIIFNWPGIGLLLYNAILQRDVPMVQGCILAIAVVFVLANLLADIIVYGLDVRRR